MIAMLFLPRILFANGAFRIVGVATGSARVNGPVGELKNFTRND
jgi:hypothetical protein